jgi:hypothetical protein
MDTPKRERHAAVGRGDGTDIPCPEEPGDLGKYKEQAEPYEKGVLDPDFLVEPGDTCKKELVGNGPQSEQNHSYQWQRPERIDAPKGQEPEGDVTPQHQEFTVGDVQDLHDAEGERQPYRCKSVDGTHVYPVDDGLR